MGTKVVIGGDELRRYLLLLLALILILGLLIFLYYIVNRPPQIVNQERTREGEDPEFRFSFAIYGFEGDLLNRPSFAAIGPDRRIYVADTMKNRVVVFDLRGNYIGLIKGEATGRFSLRWPISVAVADDGRIYVLSKQDRKIVVFNREFKPINAIEFENVIPSALAIRGDRLYVGTDRAIMIGTLDGRLLKTIGRLGKKEGQFDLIGGLAVSDDGTIYVADSLNYRIQAIDENTGKTKWVYGQPIPAQSAIRFRGPERKFGLPSSIALDERGRLYVVDGLNSEIHILDAKTGKFLKKVADIGHAEGRVYYPDGIFYGSGGYIAVADKFNDRVQIFRVPVPGVAAAIPRWLPWVALLPLLMLLLWLLFAPRVKFVAEESFVLKVLESEYRKDLESALKKLYVLKEVAERYADRFEKLKLVELQFEKSDLDEISENYGFDEKTSALLAGLRKLRGRRTLFTEQSFLRKVAEDDFDSPTMNYEELLESMYGGKKNEEKTA